MVLLPPRVRRRHLLRRHQQRPRQAPCHAQPGRGLEVYAHPTAGEAGLPRAAARPRVGQPARAADQKDVAGEETSVDALKGPVRPRGDSAVSVAGRAGAPRPQEVQDRDARDVQGVAFFSLRLLRRHVVLLVRR